MQRQRPAPITGEAAKAQSVGIAGLGLLAQNFQLPTARHVTSIDLRFAAIGDRANMVRVQIREVYLGLPTMRIVAEGDLDMADVQVDEWTNVAFTASMPLEAGRTYAVVFLTDDADHALYTADLGDAARV